MSVCIKEIVELFTKSFFSKWLKHGFSLKKRVYTLKLELDMGLWTQRDTRVVRYTLIIQIGKKQNLKLNYLLEVVFIVVEPLPYMNCR